MQIPVTKDELEAKAKELGMVGDVGNGIGFAKNGKAYVFILQDYRNDRELIMHEVTEALARQTIGGVPIAGAQNGAVAAPPEQTTLPAIVAEESKSAQLGSKSP